MMMIKRAGFTVLALALLSSFAAAQTDEPGQPGKPSTLEMIQAPFNNARSWLLDFFVAEEQAVANAIGGFIGRLTADGNQFQDLVAEAGYSLSEIAVTASLLPEVSLSMDFQRDITAEEDANLRAKLDAMSGVLGDIEHLIILGLLDLDKTIESVRPDGYALSSVDVDVDLVPGFELSFSPASE